MTDIAGTPVVNAVVKAGLVTATTDFNGMFKITDAVFTTGESFITVNKQGYFEGIRTFFAREKSNNYMKIRLMPKDGSGNFDAASGGDISLNDHKGSIHFTANSIVTSSGGAYNGNVVVHTFNMDPTGANFDDIMPGDLRAVNASGNLVGLKSFGMAAIELEGENGEKLQLKKGSPARLTINIPTSLTATAPATIPLWYFNDTTGLWKEAGQGIKSGNSYSANVSHFSFWNFDGTFNYVKIKAKIVNADGQPIQSTKVKITSSNGNCAYDYTDRNGNVDGFVPINETLKLEALDNCGNIGFTKDIGPFSSETDLGNITVSLNTTTIYGKVTNCNNAPVTNGYIQISGKNIFNYVTIVNGDFSYTLLTCSQSDSVQLLPIDKGNSQQGTTQSVKTSGYNINVDTIKACGLAAETYFDLTVNGNLFSTSSSEYIHVGYKDSVINPNNGGDADYYYFAYDTAKTKGILFNLSLPPNQIFNVPVSFPINDTLCVIQFNYGSKPDSSGELYPFYSPVQKTTFTEYGKVGEFISGNYSGLCGRRLITGSIVKDDTVNVVMKFRVRNIY